MKAVADAGPPDISRRSKSPHDGKRHRVGTWFAGLRTACGVNVEQPWEWSDDEGAPACKACDAVKAQRDGEDARKSERRVIAANMNRHARKLRGRDEWTQEQRRWYRTLADEILAGEWSTRGKGRS